MIFRFREYLVIVNLMEENKFSKVENIREHIFISYAIEDSDLAEWLTLKLTGEGYKVWCDKIKLLGGESYPKDIDYAIKNQTFRFLALLSHNSINKDNPLKERTMALNLGKQRKEEFIIPINVDGLKAIELDWMHSDITYIPFHESWAAGLKQLLKKLESIDTPKTLPNGKEIISSTLLMTDDLKNEKEAIWSNSLSINQLPKYIKKFKIVDYVDKNSREIMFRTWAFYKKDNSEVFSFQTPPSFAVKIELIEQFEWAKCVQIEGILTSNIVSNLLKRSLDVKMYEKGLHRAKKEKNGKILPGKFFFPFKMIEDDKIKFKNYKGRQTNLLVCGTRGVTKIDGTKEYYNYHIVPNFNITQPNEGFSIFLKIELYLTKADGSPLQKRSYQARRKKIAKDWWNHQWLMRLMGVISFLSNNSPNIIIGTKDDEQVIINSQLIKFESPISLLEEKEDEPTEVIDEIEDLEDEMEVEDGTE